MLSIEKILYKMETLMLQSGWIQGRYAEDRHGISVYPTSPTACRYCVLGMLRKVDPDHNRYAVVDVLAETIRSNFADHSIFSKGDDEPDIEIVSKCNDSPHTTEDDILKVLLLSKNGN